MSRIFFQIKKKWHVDGKVLLITTIFLQWECCKKKIVQHLGSNERAPYKLIGALQENNVFLIGKIVQNVPQMAHVLFDKGVILDKLFSTRTFWLGIFGGIFDWFFWLVFFIVFFNSQQYFDGNYTWFNLLLLLLLF